MAKFKFPINSLISWNARPDEVIFRVLEYDCVNDRYGLSVEKHYSFGEYTADCYKPGYKFDSGRNSLELHHTLIEPKIEWKFQIGDKIWIKKSVNKSIYTVWDIAKFVDCYVISTYGIEGAMIQTKEYTEKEFELHIPELPTCIPNDPTKSGWHWINCDHFSKSNPMPKYWDAGKQIWSKTNCNSNKAVIPELARKSGWRYDKPCNY